MTDVELKASRALEAARAFLARSPASARAPSATTRARNALNVNLDATFSAATSDDARTDADAATTGRAPETPASVALELSSESADDDEATATATATRDDDDEATVEGGRRVRLEVDEDEDVDDGARGGGESDSEGVFAVAIERERAAAAATTAAATEAEDDAETGGEAAVDAETAAALRANIDALREELEESRWAREALETRVQEAEKIAAEARSKTIESALDPQNQLTNEQVAALRAEIEQVEYLKRLLARAEQMRNVARAETKQARDKHESDLEIVRKEVAVMDAEMENLRRRVKKDKAKIEAMERATIEAADEFATLYSRQENTRRLLGACIVAILALVVRLGLSGQTFMMKNMYQY
jgi:hypothetical protein